MVFTVAVVGRTYGYHISNVKYTAIEPFEPLTTANDHSSVIINHGTYKVTKPSSQRQQTLPSNTRPRLTRAEGICNEVVES